MYKICHIRCNREYWNDLNVFSRLKKNKFYPYYSNIVKLWNETLKIDYLTFRKLIRDIIINKIKEKKYFDLILEDNQSCENWLTTNSSDNILFYQQDDDDIFLGLPANTKLADGINIFNYSFVDPIGGRRSRGYSNRQFDLYGATGTTRTVQSNHSLIVNNYGINLFKHEIWDQDHTYYNKLIELHGCNIFNFSISIQIYHLHSISLWKSLHKKPLNDLIIDSPNKFLLFVENYINSFQEALNKYQNIPSLKEIYLLYKNLI